MSEVPPPSGNWYAGQPYNQNNWDTQEISFDNILDNGYLIVAGNTTLANLAVSGNTQLANLGVTGTSNLGQLQFVGGSTTGDVNFNNNKITSLLNGTNSGDAINKSQLDTKLSLSGGLMTGVIDFNNNDIYNLYNIICTLPSRITIGISPPQNIIDYRLTYTEFSKYLLINVGSNVTGIDMVNSNIINAGSINATAITGTSLTISLPITQNAAALVYSTTLNGSTTQIGGYNLLVGTAQDLFTAGSSNNVNLISFTLPAGIWNASATMSLTNATTSPAVTAVITRIRYGFNTGAISIVTPYANTINKQDIRSLSIPATGANTQFYNFNEVLLNSSGAATTLYFNTNVVWSGPSSTGFTAVCNNLNLVRIA
jgi:hypothetical protein